MDGLNRPQAFSPDSRSRERCCVTAFIFMHAGSISNETNVHTWTS